MSCRWLTVASACAFAVGVAAQSPVEELAFAELHTEHETYYVGQPILLQLSFGVEREFAERRLIQPFRQRLDVPVRIDAAWLNELPGAAPLRPAPGSGALTSIVLGDRLGQAVRIEDRLRGGKRFLVLQLTRRYVATAPGELVVAAPRISFAYATRFRDDFLHGRVPEDRHEAAIDGEAQRLRIEPLPEDGRPAEFGGAVGSFRISATAEPRQLVVGESFRLVLRIEGNGNLSRFAAPRVQDLRDFHVFGKIEETDDLRRTITYDIAALRDTVTVLPPIRFAFFDPRPPARYRRLRTEPILLEVRPTADGVRVLKKPEVQAAGPEPAQDEAEPPRPPDIHDIVTLAAAPRAPEPDRHLSAVSLVLALLGPWALVLGRFSWHRLLVRRRPDPREVRARQAAATFRDRVDHGDGDIAAAFAEYLAARLRRPVPAVIAPELADQLGAAGIPADLSHRAASRLDRLVAVRFGGGATDGGDTRALVESLEAEFAAREAER